MLDSDPAWKRLTTRKTIYVNSPQAVPNTPVIDAENCIYLTKGKCQICQKTCEIGAVDFEQVDTFEEVDVGAIVVATGYDLYDRLNSAPIRFPM